MKRLDFKKPNYQVNVEIRGNKILELPARGNSIAIATTAEINGYSKKINDLGVSLTPVSLNDS